ncbi:MAG TPA: hypothetical protein VH500_25495 [Nitrososphaeraceae archaeon]|jgi:hypothetical protein
MYTQKVDILNESLSVYDKLNLELKKEEVRRQYPNLIARFLDYAKFEGLNGEERVSKFHNFAKTNRIIERKIKKLQTQFLSP